MQSIRTGLSGDAADICALVLSAAGIWHRPVFRRDGWTILVREQDLFRAEAELSAYELENPPVEVQESIPLPALQRRSYGGLIAAAAIASFYLALGPTEETPGLASARGAMASAICAGDFSRTITALFLHADFLHLIGNVAGFLVFGTALCSATGTGAGIFLMLCSGALGNLENAWFFRAGHLSVGASTSVFGAVGLLTGLTLILNRREASAWRAPAAGVLFIALLGNSERADLAAHVFGFLSGLVLGLGWTRAVHEMPGKRVQAILFLLAVAAVAGSFEG